MTKPLLLAALAATLTSTGCFSLQPVGLMAKQLGSRPAPTKSADGATVIPAADAPAGPLLAKAPPPPVPSSLVSPEEVSAATAADAVAKLVQELDADRQALANFPNYAEVSTVPR